MFQREKKAKAKPAKKETKQAKLDFEGEFELPSVDLLARPAANAAVQRINEESLEKNARLLGDRAGRFRRQGPDHAHPPRPGGHAL